MSQQFSISTFGKLTGLTPKALRLYEREGLLQPEVINAKTGYRYYSQAQAPTAERIRLLRSIDMPLEDIRVILTEQHSNVSQKLLQEHQKRLEAHLSHYCQALRGIEELRTRDINAYPVAIKNVPAQPVVYTQQQTSLLRIEATRERAFGELYGFLEQNDLAPTGPGFTANASAGKVEPHGDLDLDADWLIDVCVPVANVITNSSIGSRVVPAGKVAYVIHTGPYEPLFQVYKKITACLNERGLRHTGRTREIYHLTFAETKQRNDLKTEVQFYLA